MVKPKVFGLKKLVFGIRKILVGNVYISIVLERAKPHFQVYNCHKEENEEFDFDSILVVVSFAHFFLEQYVMICFHSYTSYHFITCQNHFLSLRTILFFLLNVVLSNPLPFSQCDTSSICSVCALGNLVFELGNKHLSLFVLFFS